MAGRQAGRRRDGSSRSGLITQLGEMVFLAWFVVAVVGVTLDWLAMRPTAPPTPAELKAARPRAWADWVVVYGRLYRRLPQPPPELGEVWTVRSGRICGVVNSKEAAVHHMTRFYTVNRVPVLREDDERQYIPAWLDCLDTRWFELHAGTEQTGFCASALGRATVFGQGYCRRGAQ